MSTRACLEDLVIGMAMLKCSRAMLIAENNNHNFMHINDCKLF